MGADQSNMETESDQQQQQMIYEDSSNTIEPQKNMIPYQKQTNINCTNSADTVTNNENNQLKRRRQESSTSQQSTQYTNKNTSNNNHYQAKKEKYNNIGHMKGSQSNMYNLNNSNVSSCVEIQVKKKLKTSQGQDTKINIKLSINLPEKWGDQSASLLSSIEMLGSKDLKNYEKSEILKQLAMSNIQQQNSQQNISQMEKTISQKNTHKLEILSQMLQASPDKLVKVLSVSAQPNEKENKLVTQVKITASADVAQLLVQQCQKNQNNSKSSNEFKNYYDKNSNSNGNNVNHKNPNAWIQDEDEEESDEEEYEKIDDGAQTMEMEQYNQNIEKQKREQMACEKNLMSFNPMYSDGNTTTNNYEGSSNNTGFCDSEQFTNSNNLNNYNYVYVKQQQQQQY